MQKKTKIKTPPLPQEVREVIRDNVKRLLYERELGRVLRPLEAQAKTGVSYKTVERILKADPDGSGPTVASLYYLGKPFHADVWELLRPGYKPPLMSGDSPRQNEAQIQVNLKDSAKRNASSKDRK